MERVRESMINQSLSLCPMYLLFKDHKGWSCEMGTAPPTRPIASGNAGMNMHLSELISGLVEPVVDQYVGGNEVISTEDFTAGLVELNRTLETRDPVAWWEGQKDQSGRFSACGKCRGDGRPYDRSIPELCSCPGLDPGTGHADRGPGGLKEGQPDPLPEGAKEGAGWREGKERDSTDRGPGGLKECQSTRKKGLPEEAKYRNGLRKRDAFQLAICHNPEEHEKNC